MNDNQALANACLVVRYEDTCSETVKTLKRVFTHLGLDDDRGEEIIAACAPTISAPEYYQPDFTAAQEALIRDVTREVAELFVGRDA
jgi:hypothetical protein